MNRARWTPASCRHWRTCQCTHIGCRDGWIDPPGNKAQRCPICADAIPERPPR